MAPPILFLEDTQLTFGGAPLLMGASLSVMSNARIGLVGRNGSGKSTLLKIINGDVEADKGERFVQPGTTIRYLPQEPDMSGFETLGEYASDDLIEADDPHRVNYLLSELGLTGNEPTNTVSGGEARRAALAKTLAPEPDILLLDEPTNHLDLPTIEWLENELARSRSAIIMISHDRRFLENLTKKIVWVDRGRTKTLDKSFSFFEDWRDEVLELEELDAHKLDRKIVREEHWITHGVSGRRKRNMRRVRELADLRQTRADQTKVKGNVAISQAESEQSGKLVAKLKSISKAFDERAIVKDLTLTVQRGDRIGIVGPNGAGKTTLINLITGKLSPDSGTIKLGVNLDILLLDQKRETLNPNWSLKEAMTDGSGDVVAIGETTKHVFSYMKDFLFLPEQSTTPVHALSGGERGRLMLARGLRTPSNLLVLDEPTNDLDLETLELLQEFIADYDGTVLLVSHDRDFIDRTCTSVLASNGDGSWLEYAGGYSDMVAQRGHGVRSKTISSQKKPKTSKPNEKPSISDASTKQKLNFKQQHALENLPNEIERLEFEIGKLQKAMAEPGLYAKDQRKFDKLGLALSEREEMLTSKEEEWLELEMLAEKN